VRNEDVANRSTISCDIVIFLGEVPVFPQDVLEQVLVRARRYAEHTVVSAHDATDMSFLDASLERCKVVVGEILLCGIVVVAVAASLEIIDCVVLAGRDDLLVAEIVALHSWDEVPDVVLDVVNIFTGSLLAPAPTRIAEVVHLKQLSAWCPTW
jgi:hypothetical protein